jgi:hypothetical protein
LRQQLIDEETCEWVAPEHKGRGYEVSKGQYLIIEDAELEAIEIESSHIIEIDSFVPRSEIDQRFFDTPYYVTPNEPVGQEAFAVIREAMRGKAMVALGRLVRSKRERVIALEAYDKGLLGTTLRYAYEVRETGDYFCDLPEITIAPELLRLAEHILDSKAQSLTPQPTKRRWLRTSRPSRSAPFRRANRPLPHRIRGDRNASGASSRMCRSTLPSRRAITAKLATRPCAKSSKRAHRAKLEIARKDRAHRQSWPVRCPIPGPSRNSEWNFGISSDLRLRNSRS